MADSLTTKKVTDLPESTEPADDDLFLAGSGGSASLIRYKWSNIWNKILASIRSKIIVNNLITTVAGYALDAQQGRILKEQLDEQNTKINNVGTVYIAPSLVTVTALQKTANFGSLTLPAGTYLINGSAKHSTAGGVCKIGIGTSASSMPSSNGQDIYGNAGYDVNMGSVTRIIKITATTTFYFQAWAASDFTITPMSFEAIRIM